MKNKKITRKISQGVYVLTTEGGGCIVDAVSQVSSEENPLIAVAVMKKNYTNELLHKNKTFALSVLGKDADPNIITTFGLNSMRELNKFEVVETLKETGLDIIPSSLGFMICEIVDSIENGTHTLFIGRLIEGDVYKDTEVLTYGHYQDHKEEYTKVTTAEGKAAWVCNICGYVYYGGQMPENFKCPICGVDKDNFKLKP